MAEREEISRGLSAGRKVAAIARSLGRHRSTVGREVGRAPQGQSRAYRATTAAADAAVLASTRRGGQRKLAGDPVLWAFVRVRLRACWSPDQIARELQRVYPDDRSMHLSPETIYAYIYVLPRGELKRQLIVGLRQERRYRRPQRGAAEEKRGSIAHMLSIEERPAAVADRTVPGHWEGDLLLGKWKRSALGTLVERTTRFTLLVPLTAKDAATVRRAYARSLRRVPRHLARSLTYDQGKEMSEHRQFTVSTGIQVYFAHPGSPWERGTNENTNGLVRQFFPKGTDFRQVSQREVKRVQDLLNGRPRRTLGYRKPVEVFHELVALKSGD